MKCVVYVSKEEISFTEQSLTELAKSSADRNIKNGITGYLYYHKGHFTQYIEGSASSIDNLVTVLNHEPRHTIVASFQDDVDARRFASWNMKQLLRNEMIEIRLEHIITDHVLFLDRIPSTGAKDSGPLWRMVNTLAQFQDKFTNESI